MRNYRFIVEMRDGRRYAVRASTQEQAEVLVHAYCILQAMHYDWDFTTCEQEGRATRSLADPDQFEREWMGAETVTLSVDSGN